MHNHSGLGKMALTLIIQLFQITLFFLFFNILSQLLQFSQEVLYKRKYTKGQ